jgi:hypothetical protein
MRGTVGEIEPAFGGEAFILRIGKPLCSATDHTVKLRARRRLAFELAILASWNNYGEWKSFEELME